MKASNHRSTSRFAPAGLRRVTILAAIAALIGCAGPVQAQSQTADSDRDYLLEYRITIDESDYATVALVVTQQRRNLRRITLHLDDEQFTGLSAAQGLQRDANKATWTLTANGGELSWRARLNRERSDGSNDALRRNDWAVFRTEDVIPPIASVTRVGADAITTMRFKVPAGWSVETAYPGGEFLFSIEKEGRRFDHPDGWVVAGDIGVRYDTISSTTVAVAAPRDQDARRLDVMAFVKWHMPFLKTLLPDFPDRLLIAMAGDPFFRGGLSAPNSLFMHTERPMISGNGTSTLIHELMHVGINRTAADREDWIVEGLAEFYSAQLLYRAGTVTARRYRGTMRSLQKWATEAGSLRRAMSSGATTALAVTIFAELDSEIRERSDGESSLDDVVRLIAGKDSRLSLTELRAAAAEVIGNTARALESERLSGYGKSRQGTASPIRDTE